MTTGTGRVVVFDIPSKRRVGATCPFSFSKKFFPDLATFPVVVRVIGEGTFNEPDSYLRVHRMDEDFFV